MKRRGRPPLDLTPEEREARKREQNRARAVRKRERDRRGRSVFLPKQIADELPEPDEASLEEMLKSLRLALSRDFP